MQAPKHGQPEMTLLTLTQDEKLLAYAIVLYRHSVTISIFQHVSRLTELHYCFSRGSETLNMFHMSINLPFSSSVGAKIRRNRERRGRGIGGIECKTVVKQNTE